MHKMLAEQKERQQIQRRLKKQAAADELQKAQRTAAWTDYPAPPRALVHGNAPEDALAKLEARLTGSGLALQKIHDLLEPLRKMQKEIAGLGGLGDRLDKLADKWLIAEHGERGEALLQKRDAARQEETLRKREHYSHAELQSGDEIVDDFGQRHECAELVKVAWGSGPDDFYKE